MASVNSSVEIVLTKEEKELLEKAIAKIKDIHEDVAYEAGLYVEESDIYLILSSEMKQNNGKLPIVIDIDE